MTITSNTTTAPPTTPVRPRPTARPDRDVHRPAGPPSAWRQPVPGPHLPGIVTGVTLALGLWLMIAPAAWSYGGTGTGIDARWNDILVGAAIAAVAVARMTRAARLGPTQLIAAVLGCWLIMAPFVLAYGFGGGSTRATLNDLTVGLLVFLLATAGYISGRMAVNTHL